MARTPAVPPVGIVDEEMIEVAIDEATHSQLMWFSRNQKNLDVDEMETHNQTLNRLKAVWEHPTIRVPAVIEPPKVFTSRIETTTAADRYGLPETVDVIIQGDGLTEDDTFKMAHNGTTYIAQVGKVVTLPWYVFKGCIDDAKEVRYAVGRDTGLGPSHVRHAVQFTRVR